MNTVAADTELLLQPLEVYRQVVVQVLRQDLGNWHGRDTVISEPQQYPWRLTS